MVLALAPHRASREGWFPDQVWPGPTGRYRMEAWGRRGRGRRRGSTCRAGRRRCGRRGAPLDSRSLPGRTWASVARKGRCTKGETALNASYSYAVGLAVPNRAPGYCQLVCKGESSFGYVEASSYGPHGDAATCVSISAALLYTSLLLLMDIRPCMPAQASSYCVVSKCRPSAAGRLSPLPAPCSALAAPHHAPRARTGP